MATSWTPLNTLSQPKWILTSDSAVFWQRFPSLSAAQEVGFGEGGFGEGGFDPPASNQAGLSQPVWIPWTID